MKKETMECGGRKGIADDGLDEEGDEVVWGTEQNRR